MYQKPYVYPVHNEFGLAVDNGKLDGVLGVLKKAGVKCSSMGESKCSWAGYETSRYTTLRIMGSNKRELESLFACKIVENTGSPAEISMAVKGLRRN